MGQEVVVSQQTQYTVLWASELRNPAFLWIYSCYFCFEFLLAIQVFLRFLSTMNSQKRLLQLCCELGNLSISGVFYSNEICRNPIRKFGIIVNLSNMFRCGHWVQNYKKGVNAHKSGHTNLAYLVNHAENIQKDGINTIWAFWPLYLHERVFFSYVWSLCSKGCFSSVLVLRACLSVGK